MDRWPSKTLGSSWIRTTRSFRSFNYIGLAPACILLVTALIACGPSSSFDDHWQKMSWDQIVSEARGQTVNFYMWGGSDTSNRYVSAYLGQRLKHEHGVTLNRVPVTDSSVYVNKVLGEKQANLLSGGSVDLVWINGENFRTMKTGGLLFGPYAHLLPNIEYVDTTAASIANDFGFPTDGFETPWGASQFVMAYDSARLSNPPTSIDELIAWIKNNPGKFTYAAMPDFTGICRASPCALNTPSVRLTRSRAKLRSTPRNANCPIRRRKPSSINPSAVPTSTTTCNWPSP